MNQKVLFFSPKIKTDYDVLTAQLYNLIEYMFRMEYRKSDEKVQAYLEKECSPRALFRLVEQIREVENDMQLGSIDIPLD